MVTLEHKNLVWQFTVFVFSKMNYIRPFSDWWTNENNSEVSLFESVVFKKTDAEIWHCLNLEMDDFSLRFGLNYENFTTSPVAQQYSSTLMYENICKLKVVNASCEHAICICAPSHKMGHPPCWVWHEDSMHEHQRRLDMCHQYVINMSRILMCTELSSWYSKVKCSYTVRR